MSQAIKLMKPIVDKAAADTEAVQRAALEAAAAASVQLEKAKGSRTLLQGLRAAQNATKELLQFEREQKEV